MHREPVGPLPCSQLPTPAPASSCTYLCIGSWDALFKWHRFEIIPSPAPGSVQHDKQYSQQAPPAMLSITRQTSHPSEPLSRKTLQTDRKEGDKEGRAMIFFSCSKPCAMLADIIFTWRHREQVAKTQCGVFLFYFIWAIIFNIHAIRGFCCSYLSMYLLQTPGSNCWTAHVIFPKVQGGGREESGECVSSLGVSWQYPASTSAMVE